MRKLAIAYGNSRQAKKWVNKEITFDALKDRLKTPIRTTESAEEYAKFSKGQKDNAKDHGGFVAGVLKGGRRKNDTVELRSMIALDGEERTDFSDGGNGTICGLDDLYMWYIDGQVQNGLFDINQEYYIEVIGNIYENPELMEGVEDDT